MSSGDLVRKRSNYAEAAIPEYWIVEPTTETITVLTLAGGAYVERGVFDREAYASSVLDRGRLHRRRQQGNLLAPRDLGRRGHRGAVRLLTPAPPRDVRRPRRPLWSITLNHRKQEEDYVTDAYCNYFLRPAPQAGGSMQGNEDRQDVAVAEQVLRWFILTHRPQLVIVTSRFASRYAADVVRGYGIPCLSTPHPGSRWWNTKARSYGNLTGRGLFVRFLKERNWLVTNA